MSRVYDRWGFADPRRAARTFRQTWRAGLAVLALASGAGCQDRDSCPVTSGGFAVRCQVFEGDPGGAAETSVDMRGPEARALAREVGAQVLAALAERGHWSARGSCWYTVTAGSGSLSGQVVELQGVRLRIVVQRQLSALARRQGTTGRCRTSLQASAMRMRPLLDKYWAGAPAAGPVFFQGTYENGGGSWKCADWPAETLGPGLEPARALTPAEMPAS